jgi:hypothetical protein
VKRLMGHVQKSACNRCKLYFNIDEHGWKLEISHSIRWNSSTSNTHNICTTIYERGGKDHYDITWARLYYWPEWLKIGKSPRSSHVVA